MMLKSKGNQFQKTIRNKSVVIAIDGPAGAGKSTIAKEVARRLNFTYLDTGAMYRAVTLKAMRSNIDFKNRTILVNLAKKIKINIKSTKSCSLKIFLDNKEVTKAIRTPEITQNVSFIARIPALRKIMVAQQRKIGRNNNVVVEGRDITTVVFPGAFKKFYLDANFKERVKRRSKDFKQLKQNLRDKDIMNDLRSRDNADMTRKVGPLKKAKDAICIDSTKMTIKKVVDTIIQNINNNG